MYCFVCTFGIRTVYLLKTRKNISQLVRTSTTSKAAVCAGCPHWSSNGCVMHALKEKNTIKNIRIAYSVLSFVNFWKIFFFFFLNGQHFPCSFVAAISVHSTHSSHSGHGMSLCHSFADGIAFKIAISMRISTNGSETVGRQRINQGS